MPLMGQVLRRSDVREQTNRRCWEAFRRQTWMTVREN